MSTSSQNGEPTVFDHALEDYLSSLPKGNAKSKFFDLCRNTGDLTAEQLNNLIQDELSKRNLHGPANRLFNRLAGAIMDYSGVIEQFASAQPLPLSIIWGGLKIIIEIAGRRKEAFDLMSKELRALLDQLYIINDYEGLYGDSDEMQTLIFRSYKNIIRFWHRVYKECSTTNFGSFGRSMTSGKLSKLKAIVDDLKTDAESISEKGKVLEASLNAKERHEAEKEREKADEERNQQKLWRRKQNAHNYIDLRTKIREFLIPPIFATNEACHQKNLQQYLEDTCRWITTYPDYEVWSDPAPNPSPPEKRILCVNGPAGFGKSILSSFAIRHLQKRHGAVVVYYFCQLTAPCDNACDILRLLGLQLFDDYCARRLPIDEDLCNEVIGCKSQEQFQELIGKLSVGLRPHPIYFIFDGLDEAQKPNAQQALSSTIEFICNEMLHNSRLWVTQRRQVQLSKCYDLVISPRPHCKLEIHDHTEGDVGTYLDTKLGELERRFGDIGERDRYVFQFAKVHLKLLAKGHFLWARLMTEDFEGVVDVQDLFKRITRPPTHLDELYKTFFNRIRPENRNIASKVIGLVAFARRQLRIEEIRDVITCLARGRKSDNENLTAMSSTNFFSKYTVLIELDKGDDESEGSCRLVHSSVFEFLLHHPAILGEERSLHITPYITADACLTYLTRPIFINLLQRQADGSQWADSTGRSMGEHHFAYYAAKYWSRHLENPELERSMRGRVIKFVESKNFQTCLQIQSIWVQGNFDTYSFGDQKTVLRALPDWLIYTSPSRARQRKPTKYWLDYCNLLHNWRRLLSCGGCHDNKPDCPLLMYRGDIDRVWWATFGTEHIFSGFRGRYTSFSLADDSERNVHIFDKTETFEALCVTVDHVLRLRLNTWNRQSGILDFTCARWKRENSNRAPTLVKQQVIQTDEYATNWRLFGRRSTDESVQLVARHTIFNTTGEFLRIGSQLFIMDNDQEYIPLEGSLDNEEMPVYFEDFANRGFLLATASRAYTVAEEVLKPKDLTEVFCFGWDFLHLERLAKSKLKRNKSASYDSSSFGNGNSENDASDSSSPSSSNPSDAAEGHESWSDGSSSIDNRNNPYAVEDVIDSSDSSSSSSANTSSTSGSESGKETDSESEQSTKSNGTRSDAASSESDSAESFVEPEFDEYGEPKIQFVPSTIEVHHGEGMVKFKPLLEKSKTAPDNKMLLTVFDTRCSPPRKLFQYTHPFNFSFMLFDSPPAIHPSKPLVVWALERTEILFVDFALKTYFVQCLRSNLPSGRNVVSVNLHFHSNGRYLHVASLETQQQPRRNEASAQGPPPFKLFTVLSTYRLSSKNTTRRPPSLIHRVKANFGKYIAFQPKSLPTFAWTSEDVFVTQRARELVVYRIPLFSSSSSKQKILVPKNKIFLPNTAESCAVHFNPAIKKAPAHIIIGSESGQPGWSGLNADTEQVARFASAAQDALTNRSDIARKMLARPMGCLLKEEDIGGWVSLGNTQEPSSPNPRKNERREKFNAADDFDHVEPYLRFGSRSPVNRGGSQDADGRVSVKVE